MNKPTTNNPKRTSNKELYRRVQGLTGMNRDDAKLATRAVIASIHDLLLEGTPLTLNNLGKFTFKHRKGRVIPAREVACKYGGTRTMPETHQSDSYRLAFKAAPEFKKKLKTVKPQTTENDENE